MKQILENLKINNCKEQDKIRSIQYELEKCNIENQKNILKKLSPEELEKLNNLYDFQIEMLKNDLEKYRKKISAELFN